MIVNSIKGNQVSPVMETIVNHTINDTVENKEDLPFHVYTGSEQSSLKCLFTDGTTQILKNYNNQVLLHVLKVFSTDTTTPADIVCYR